MQHILARGAAPCLTQDQTGKIFETFFDFVNVLLNYQFDMGLLLNDFSTRQALASAKTFPRSYFPQN